MSESRRGIINGAETATTCHATQEKTEEPYDPQQTSKQRGLQHESTQLRNTKPLAACDHRWEAARKAQERVFHLK